MKEVKVLGPGCKRCVATVEMVQITTNRIFTRKEFLSCFFCNNCSKWFIQNLFSFTSYPFQSGFSEIKNTKKRRFSHNNSIIKCE